MQNNLHTLSHVYVPARFTKLKATVLKKLLLKGIHFKGIAAHVNPQRKTYSFQYTQETTSIFKTKCFETLTKKSTGHEGWAPYHPKQ